MNFITTKPNFQTPRVKVMIKNEYQIRINHLQWKSNMWECSQYLNDAGVYEISKWTEGNKMNVRLTRL